MQKIRIKRKKLNEAGTQQAPQQKPKSANAEAYEATCKKMFKAECAKNHLNVPLAIPKSCDSISTGLKKAPIDLKALMQNLSATEMETFKNTDGMMQDPINTFNAAEDFAASAFQNIPEKLKITPNKKSDDDEDVDLDDVEDDEDDDTNEGVGLTSLGISYGHINEGELGPKLGNLAGQIAKAGIETTGHVIGGIAGASAPAAAGATAAGMVAGAATDAVPSSHTDDSRFENRKDKVKTDQKSDKGAQYKGDNAIEAIAQYITNVVESVAQFAASLGASDEAISTFKKQMGLYIKHNDDLCNKYIEENDEVIKSLKGTQDKDEKRKLVRMKNLKDIQRRMMMYVAQSTVEFDNEMSTIIDGITSLKTANKAKDTLIDKIKNGHPSNPDKQKTAIANLEKLDLTDLITESQTYQYMKHLNEEESLESDDKEAGLIDGNKVYDGFTQKIKELCSPLVPKNGQNLPGYAEAKASMEAMAKEANTEICGKIDELCKVGDGQSDFSAKVSKFLSNHPLNAKGLKGVWSRYYEELNSRKNRRLKAMQDLSRTEYSQGWACNIITTVVPHTLAKMFMYRYILKLLKNKGIYSYTPLQEQKEEEFWEENKEELLKQQPVIVKVVWDINNSKLSSDSATSVASIDDDGNFIISGSLPYLGLYLAQLKNADKIKGETLIDTVQQFVPDNGESFIQTMFDNYKTCGYGRTLASSIDNACKVFGKTFDVSIDTIRDAYEELSKISLDKVNEKSAAATLSFINNWVNGPDTAFDDVKELMKLYDTSIKDMIADKKFDDIQNVLGTDASTRIGNAANDGSTNSGSGKALKDALVFNADKDDRYIKVDSIKSSVDILKDRSTLDKDTLDCLVTVCKLVQSQFLDYFFIKMNNEFKVQGILNSLHNAYQKAFYEASPDTDDLANLYKVNGVEISKQAIDNIVQDASVIDVSIKEAFKYIGVDPKQLFDKSDIDPYIDITNFNLFIEKYSDALTPSNVSETEENEAYIKTLAESAAKVVEETIKAVGADDGINFQTVWPSLHQVALLSTQLLKDIETVQKDGKLSGNHAKPIYLAYKELKEWIAAVNKEFGTTDIVNVLATTENYNEILDNKELVPYLPKLISLESDDPKWEKNWAMMKKVIGNLVTAFDLKDKKEVI